jgi:hypothetical protein
MTAVAAGKNEKLRAITAFLRHTQPVIVTGSARSLPRPSSGRSPGHHPLSGSKHGVDEVLAFFDALAAAGFKADTYFLEANDEYVVDIHRGYSTAGVGGVDTT